MADKTISDLVSASRVNPPDLFVLEQNSTAKKLSGQTLVTYLLAMIDGHGGIVNIAWSTSGQSGNGQTHTGKEHREIILRDACDSLTNL